MKQKATRRRIRTPWFCIGKHGQPVRVGWYDVKYAPDDTSIVRRYWDGKRWRFGALSLYCAFGNNPGDWRHEFWRGLLEPSKIKAS